MAEKRRFFLVHNNGNGKRLRIDADEVVSYGEASSGPGTEILYSGEQVAVSEDFDQVQQMVEGIQ